MPEIHNATVPHILELQGFGSAGIQAMVSRMAHVARTNLVMRAQQELRTSARDYVRAIQPIKVERRGSRVVAVMELRGAFPNMVENGAQSWDLRETILKPGTRRLKRSKQGFLYAHIPFRHAGPTAGGRDAAPMGSAMTRDNQGPHHRAFRGEMNRMEAQAMGRAVRRAAGRLAATRSTPGGGVQYGGSLPAGTADAQPLRPRHATDLYAGMYREEKTYERATQSKFMTFRTISQNPASKRSDAAGGASEVNWTHPGLTARFLIPKTEVYISALFSSGAFDVR